MEKIAGLSKQNEIECELESISNTINKYPGILPGILDLISQNLTEFQSKCKKENDWLLREALGDACGVIYNNSTRKRRFSKKDLRIYCQRIKNAVFPSGINSNYHHLNEQKFYKWLWGEEDGDVHSSKEITS